MADKARNGAGTIARGTAAAAVGTAVAALAGRALISRRGRKRVLGVPVPRKPTNVTSVAKRLSRVAEGLEKQSLEVSKASRRAKEAANMLS
jgi:hypothetical protein